MEKSDHILDALVGSDTTNAEDVRQVVVEIRCQQVIGRDIEMVKARDDRQDPGSREPHVLQLPAVELGVTQGEIAPGGVLLQLTAAAVAQAAPALG